MSEPLRSLRRRLLVILSLPLFAMLAVSMIVDYRSALSIASEARDEALVRITAGDVFYVVVQSPPFVDHHDTRIVSWSFWFRVVPTKRSCIHLCDAHTCLEIHTEETRIVPISRVGNTDSIRHDLAFWTYHRDRSS